MEGYPFAPNYAEISDQDGSTLRVHYVDEGPAEQSDYTYERHVAWMHELLLDHLDLNNVTFFSQDWGGLIGGGTLAALSPDEIAAYNAPLLLTSLLAPRR